MLGGISLELDRDLRDGEVADPLAVGDAAAHNDRRFLQTVEELGHEPRLADAGRSEDGEELASPVGDDVGESLFEQMPLPLAADHRPDVDSSSRSLIDRDKPIGGKRL